MTWRSGTTYLLIGVDLSAILLLRPDVALLGRLCAPGHWVASAGPDRVVVDLTAVALWLVSCWLGIALAACALARRPERLGGVADALAGIALPRAAYRLLAGATGLGVLLGPVAASAGGPDPSGPRNTHVASPAWPSADPVPAPSWPTDPVVEPAPRPAARPAAPASVVTVEPGDSLWSIAAEHLPRPAGARRIAAAWPRWYAANRAVIGADPSLIRPGLRLHSPVEESQR